MNSPGNQPIIDKFNDLIKINERLISEHEKDQINGIENLVNIQYETASYFFGFWLHRKMPLRKGHKELMPLLFSLFYRNFVSYFSALKLTVNGLYMPARPLLRNIFESLMIAKFCNINDDVRVMKKWNLGETVYFVNSILKKITIPNPMPFYDFWGHICEYTHATKSSLQILLEFEKEENIDGVSENLAMINTLLECNYHLLNTHLITPRLGYMAKLYTAMDYRIPELRKEAHSQFKRNRKYLGSESIKLISAYKRKWQIRN